MSPLGRAPPVVGLALAAGAGAVLRHLGVSPTWTLPLLALLLLPNRASRRPASSSQGAAVPEVVPRASRRPASPAPGAAVPEGPIAPSRRPVRVHPAAPLALAVLAGSLLTDGWYRREATDCRLALGDGQTLSVEGRLLGEVVEGRGELLPDLREAAGCPEPLRLIFQGGAGDGPAPGARVAVTGSWRRSGAGGMVTPLLSGYLLVREYRTAAPGEEEGGGTRRPSLREVLAMAGGGVQRRLGELFPGKKGLAAALVLARKEGLDPELRDAFARAGTAHLLAISGFHVGVVAGLLLLLLGSTGLPHPARFLLASLGVWAYVLTIGLPDAAVRAALILTCLAAGRLVSRSVVPLGALAGAFLLFLPFDPGALMRPGFQLSFAGALGLLLWSRSIASSIAAAGRGKVAPALSSSIAAGVAATLGTLPLVAWHFGRVSVVGIPATLLAAPLVTLAIPGIFACLLLSALHPAAGALLARGVELELTLLQLLVEGAARLPMASIWVSRPAVVAGVVGLLVAWLARQARPRAVAASWLAVGSLAGVLLWPLGEQALGRGALELVVLDVGQGDAVLIRSPRGRWILVDTGPRSESFDAGERAILPYLRRRGVAALDLLVLTHPDLDHIGGAAAVLRGIPVGAVLDPGEAPGRDALVETLEEARAREVPWRVAAAGDSLELDGVAIRVVAPERRSPLDPATARDGGGEEEGSNGASLVLELRYGEFAALLAGDAPSASEVRLLPRLLSPRFQLLKVGHHGSTTSTSAELLERSAPETAVISAGRRNRFGHPHPSVVLRLEGAGARVLRTDLLGTLRVRARRDGSHAVTEGG